VEGVIKTGAGRSFFRKKRKIKRKREKNRFFDRIPPEGKSGGEKKFLGKEVPFTVTMVVGNRKSCKGKVLNPPEFYLFPLLKIFLEHFQGEFPSLRPFLPDLEKKNRLTGGGISLIIREKEGYLCTVPSR